MKLIWKLTLVFMSMIKAFSVGGSDTPAHKSEITYLPGFNGGAFRSRQFGGFLTVDEANGRALYYYLVESENNPTTDPLVLWLNGGPGCSSSYGWVYEHGPFTFAPAAPGSSASLSINPYSWSKAANMLYLDSPAGVGFSFSNTSADYNTSDTKTAQDVHTFLLRWLELYPRFQGNSLYLAGESWAGVYVPTLVQHIHYGIVAGRKPDINLKGYLLGNPSTDKAVDQNALVPFMHAAALISEDQYQAAEANCNGSYLPPFTSKCYDTLIQIDETTAHINMYNILEPCYHDDLNAGDDHSYNHRVVVPCTDDRLALAWLNDDAVRAAIHADSSNVREPWVLCTNVLNYEKDAGSMIPLHRKARHQGYRALLYSGDQDLDVPYTGTESWTRGLGYETIERWRPWHLDGEVAGFAVKYEHDLTFATVKGSGHAVPHHKPAQALAMFQRWLKSEAL